MSNAYQKMKVLLQKIMLVMHLKGENSDNISTYSDYYYVWRDEQQISIKLLAY